MVELGAAEPLTPEDYSYINEERETVDNKEESVGMQIEIKITHPHWILFGDKFGTDTSQKNDGNVGDQ